MNYRTTCPSCASVFRLGEDQLGAAQGWVQCSVCGAAFDARPSLLLEDGSPVPQPAPEPEPVAAAASPAEPEPPQAEPEEPVAATESGNQPEAAVLPEAPAAAEPPRGIVQRETAPDLDSIILIDPDIPVPDDYGPMPQIRATPASGTSGLLLMYPPPYTRAPTSLSAGTGVATPPAACPLETPRTQPPAAPAKAKAMPAAPIEYPTAPAQPGQRKRQLPLRLPRMRPWMWAVASGLLAIVLLAQITFFLRDTLVSRLPQTRPAFEQACVALGCSLSLPKNLAQLQVVGSDLQTEASGRLKLTLTLGNRAGHAQAWPVLVLTLTDQRNRPLARRSFAPSEYLGDPRRIEAGIPPRGEQVLSLPLTVRGPAPMGFDLQLSY